MRTLQIRLTEKQVREIESLVRDGLYPSRSEAIRDSVRRLIAEKKPR